MLEPFVSDMKRVKTALPKHGSVLCITVTGYIHCVIEEQSSRKQDNNLSY
jgi:hypothetical protein